MEIKNAKYVKQLSNISYIEAELDGVLSNIPIDENNMHYVEVKKQVDAGTLTLKNAE